MDSNILAYNIYGIKSNIEKLTTSDVIKKLYDIGGIEFPNTFTLHEDVNVFDTVLGYCNIPPLRIKNIDFLDKYPHYAMKYLTYDVSYILNNISTCKQLYEFYCLKKDNKILYQTCLQYKEIYIDFIIYYADYSDVSHNVCNKISTLDMTYEKVIMLLDKYCMTRSLLRKIYDNQPEIIKYLIAYEGKDYYDESYIIMNKIESLYNIVDIKYTSMEIALRCGNDKIIREYCPEDIAMQLYENMILVYKNMSDDMLLNDAMKECILKSNNRYAILDNVELLDGNRGCEVMLKLSIRDMLDFAYEYNKLYPKYIFDNMLPKYIYNDIVVISQIEDLLKEEDTWNNYRNYLPIDKNNISWPLLYFELSEHDLSHALKHINPKYYPKRLRRICEKDMSYASQYIIDNSLYIYVNDELMENILDKLDYAEKPFIAYYEHLTDKILDKCSNRKEWWIVKALIRYRSKSIECNYIRENINIIANNVDKFIGIHEWLDIYIKQ